MVIGSRGDIQPFLKIAKILKEQHGHRVRIASHPVFRDFVQEEEGLEFFSVGGDPAELMAFMVNNPGLVPHLATIREGEIQRRRSAMAMMFEGFWRASTNIRDGEEDVENLKMMDETDPFVADCIIANPPSMAHVHIAEKLGIPLHMMQVLSLRRSNGLLILAQVHVSLHSPHSNSLILWRISSHTGTR